jgi:hypothetical protein
MATAETVDVRPEAPPHEHPPVSDLALWTTVLSGPGLFLLNLEISYVMVDWACNTGNAWALHVVHLVSLVATVAGTLLGIVLWRRVGGGWPDSGGGSVSRSRLLATLGTLGGLLFSISILAQWITVMVLGPCLRA